MVKKMLTLAVILALAFAPAADMPAYAEEKTPCRATLTLICEEGYEPVEFTLTDDDGGTYTYTVSAEDGYRKTVSIPEGTYTASARIPGMEEGSYEVFLDDAPQATDEKGTYHFTALAGSWLYTVQNAGLLGKSMLDKNGDPLRFGIVNGDEALMLITEAEDADPAESYVAMAGEQADVPTEFELPEGTEILPGTEHEDPEPQKSASGTPAITPGDGHAESHAWMFAGTRAAALVLIAGITALLVKRSKKP